MRSSTHRVFLTALLLSAVWLPAARAQSQSPDAWNQQGKAAFEQKDFARAVECFRKAVELDPAKAVYVTNLAAAYQETARFDEARQLLEATLKAFADAETRRTLAVALADTHFAWAEGLRQQGGYAEAIAHYQAAYELDRIHRQKEAGIDLNNLGMSHHALGQYEKAIDSYERALPILRKEKDRVDEGTLLNNLGEAYRELSQPAKAIGYFTESLKITREVKDRQGEGLTLNNLALSHQALSQSEKAVDYFDEALGIFRELKDQRNEAMALSNRGLSYMALSRYDKALETFEQALPVLRTVGERQGEGVALNNIGQALNAMGLPERAIPYLEQALPIARETKDRLNEGAVLNNLGDAARRLSRYEKAAGYFAQARQIFHEIRNANYEALALNNLGESYRAVGLYEQAIGFYEQARLSLRRMGDRRGEALTLGNQGMSLLLLSQHQKAIDYFEAALELLREVKDRQGEAIMLDNLGGVYRTLDQHKKAIGYFERALGICREIKDRQDEGMTLNNLGAAYQDLDQLLQSAGLYAQALEIFRAIGNRQSEGTSLNNLGGVSRSLDRMDKATEYYERALAIYREVKDRHGEGVALNNLATVYRSLKEYDKAVACFEQSLKIRRELKDRDGEAVTLGNLAGLEYKRGNLTAALTGVQAALAIVESIRGKLYGEELRSSYFSSQQQYYELLIDVQMQLHKQRPDENRHVAAFEASEGARARTLLEALRESGADIRRGVDQQLIKRERELQKQLNAKADLQMKLLGSGQRPGEALAIGKEIESLTSQYQDVERQIRATSPRYAALTQPVPLTLAQIQRQVLDEDTMLLEYSLGEERSWMWAVTQNGIRSYELPEREKIETAAREVRRLLTTRNRRKKDETPEQRQARVAEAEAKLPEAAAQLSRMILAPVYAQLGANRRLLVVSDGALQYVPFAMLPIPQDESGKMKVEQGGGRLVPLVVEHEIVSLPSASTLAVQRQELAGRKPPVKALMVLADPVFEESDERLKTGKAAGKQKPTRRVVSERLLHQLAGEGEDAQTEMVIPRLPYTRREAEKILALAPAAENQKALDFAASRATAGGEELGQYRYVHFATHGYFDSEHPELSAIVLAMVDEQGRPVDGFLRMHEVFNLSLPVEMVVLSACETGLGKEVKGEGLVGLTRGFMYAGAARVVVSLWSVNDEGTAELMVRFYRKLLVEKMRPAAALAAAQAGMWKEQKWAAPYYWAPFVLQGEWR